MEEFILLYLKKDHKAFNLVKSAVYQRNKEAYIQHGYAEATYEMVASYMKDRPHVFGALAPNKKADITPKEKSTEPAPEKIEQTTEPTAKKSNSKTKKQ